MTTPKKPRPAPVTLGDRIRVARLAAGLSQTAFADKYGCAQRSISQWEHAQDMRVSTLVAIARAIGCPVQELLP